MRNPFEFPIAGQESKSTSPEQETDVRIDVAEEKTRWVVTITTPDERMRRRYVLSADAVCERYGLSEVRMIGSAEIGFYAKKDGPSTGGVPMTRERLDEIFDEIRRDTTATFVEETIEEEQKKMEEMKKEDAAYDLEKKHFLTKLLEKTATIEDLPVHIHGPNELITYRTFPGDLIEKTVQTVMDKYLCYPDEQGTMDDVYPGAFKLKTHRKRIPELGNDGQSEQKLKEAVLAEFMDYLKNGAGRNKIKLELKRLDPDYKPANNVNG